MQRAMSFDSGQLIKGSTIYKLESTKSGNMWRTTCNYSNIFYACLMETGGTKNKMSGYIANQQGDSTLIELAEALELLEWLEVQRILWGYGSTPSNSPNLDRIH